jgi:hypothetical protein
MLRRVYWQSVTDVSEQRVVPVFQVSTPQDATERLSRNVDNYQ